MTIVGVTQALEALAACAAQQFTTAEEAVAPARGRSVEVEPRNGRQTRRQKELISRNFSKPSDGLEPSTPPYHFSVERGSESEQ